MSEYVSEAVPFVMIGNRRGLTDKQIEEDPYIKDFFLRFQDCFERDYVRSLWIFDR